MHSESAFLGVGAPASGASAPVELDDGRRVTITPVDPRDDSAECAFVAALSLTSRYRRFHFGLRELTPEAAHAMTAIDQEHHVAFVARAGDDPAIVADARYVRRADSAEAEFAIVVGDDWQGHGLGRALLVRLIERARAGGLRRLYGDVLWGNPAMLGLLRDLGAALRRHPSDATMVRAELILDAAAAAAG